MKKVSDYYMGGELIDALGILPIELMGAIRRGVVPPPSSEIKEGESRTPDSDPALFDPALCESPQAWVEMVRSARFFKPWVQVAMPGILAELGTCWQSDDTDQGQEAAAPEAPSHGQRAEEIDPKSYAERELAQGKAPGQVMLALAKLFDDMPKWKAAGLALRRPVVGLDQFEKDKLKSRFYDRTKKFKQ